MPDSWLDHKNDEYNGRQMESVRAHLNGDVLNNVEKYLIRKNQGESEKAYESRKKIASYIPHYTRAVLALAGMIIQNEDEMRREWWTDPRLGDPNTDGSAMATLWRNVDGMGMDWNVMRTLSLVEQIGHQEVWTLVEGVTRMGGGDDMPTLADALNSGRVRIINPLAVHDWVEDSTGRLVSVKVESEVDRRQSVMQPTNKEKRYHVFSLDGMTEWRKGEEGPQQVSSSPYGPGGFTYEGRDGRPVLPIFRTKVPVRSPVGFLMAQFAEWLFNFRNMRNFHLWSSALARAWTDATDDAGRLDEDMYDKIIELVKEGASWFPAELGYSAPPMEGASTRNDTLEEETENFYSVFFQSFGDVARERTATEINQQVAQSVGAYLTLQTQSLDEWENDVLWRIAQVNAPDAGPSLWGEAEVERSTDFSQINVGQQIQNLSESAFKGPVPLGDTGRVNAAMKFADLMNIPVVEQEIRDDVQSQGGVQNILQRIRQQNPENSPENGEMNL